MKSAGNAVISTLLMHRSHGLQHLRHKRPTFAFTGKSGYTLGFAQRIAHNGSHAETVAFPPSATVRLCATSEIPFISPCFIYIHFPVLCEPPLSAEREKIRRNCRHKFYPQTAFHCVFQLLAQMTHVRFHSRKRVHTRFSEKDRAQALTRRNTGRFGWGRYCYPRTVSRVLQPLRSQGVKRRTLPLLGLGRVCFRRTQKAFGTAMRSCASLF